MDAVLLDTDVFSYLARANDPRGDAYRPHIKGKTLAISFIMVGEIYFGAEKKKWSSKTLSTFLERLKAVVVVPYDMELC
jgi:predicted nucleic acid-binding protein